MCGRFYVPFQALDWIVGQLPEDQRASAQLVIADWIKLVNSPGGHFDVRPTNQVPVWTRGGVALMRWGFKRDFSGAIINATIEKAQGRFWAKAFRTRRALVPAAGWFEWRDEGAKRKQPYAIEGPEALTFGALYEEPADPGPSFTIVTTPAAEYLAHLHARMPVVVAAEHRQAWLDPETPVEMLLKIVEPAAAGLASYQCASPKRDVRPKAP